MKVSISCERCDSELGRYEVVSMQDAGRDPGQSADHIVLTIERVGELRIVKTHDGARLALCAECRQELDASLESFKKKKVK